MKLVIFVLSLLALTACARPSSGNTDGAAIVYGQTSPYQLLISSSDLTPGRSRLTLTLWDGPQRLTEAQALDVALYTLEEDGTATEQVWEGAATGYQMGDFQYWVAYPDFPSAGRYGIQATVTNNEGEQVDNQALLEVKAEADAPSIGEPAPRTDTRTLDDAPIEALTSAPPFIEEYYQLSVAEAAESGKPSIIVFATPGLCTSALCAPVLDAAETVRQEVGDAVNVVHVEIYEDFEERTLNPAVEEWNLPSEPWVFVLDEEGTIAARLDGPVSPDELRAAVQEVQGG
jgi:hypothetical protein